MTVQVLRSIEVDVDVLARGLLMDSHYTGDDEVVLEVYRWIVNTASESGRRWRTRDRWAWNRYPNLLKQFGVDTYRDAPIAFALGDRRWREPVAHAITRAALGAGETVERWRRDRGNLRRAEIPALIHRARDKRRFTGLDRLLEVPDAKRLVPQFNSVHAGARCPFKFLLIPREDGWVFGLRYGFPELGRTIAPTSSWVAWQPGAMDDEDPEHGMPVQGEREPLGAFIERCADYKNSILEPLP